MTGITLVTGGSNIRPSKARKVVALAAALVLLAILGGIPTAAGQGQGSSPFQNPSTQTPGVSRIPQIRPSGFPKHSEKRKQAIVDYNFKQMKKHAADLAELAKSLQKEIEKSNENVLSLEIVKKANQVEKLAKKIKNEAKGY